MDKLKRIAERELGEEVVIIRRAKWLEDLTSQVPQAVHLGTCLPPPNRDTWSELRSRLPAIWFDPTWAVIPLPRTMGTVVRFDVARSSHRASVALISFQYFKPGEFSLEGTRWEVYKLAPRVDGDARSCPGNDIERLVQLIAEALDE